jgi:hypothetical protein
LSRSVGVGDCGSGRGEVKIKMMRAKLHQVQQIDNKCAALKLAIKLAARTSLMPSDEYSNNLRTR